MTDLDFYETPEWVVKHMSDLAWQTGADYICEPSAGDGAILRALPRTDLEAWEIDPGRAAGLKEQGFRCWNADYLTSTQRYELTIGNPPYSQAFAFVQHAVAHSDKVIFLLRLDFLGGKARSDWWKANPPSRLGVLSSRPSFTGGGTDWYNYGIFCWGVDGSPFFWLDKPTDR
jgi:hypothetical protein